MTIKLCLWLEELNQKDVKGAHYIETAMDLPKNSFISAQ